MLIGAIEAATQEHVSGWLYSPVQDLQGALVLAFVDGECVGTGSIGLHRQDLQDAGLSHGQFGYHFPVRLPDAAAVGRMVVSLDRCEAMILQRGSRVLPAGGTSAPRLGADPPDADLLDWLTERGALAPAEREVVATLHSFGVAGWPLETAPGRRVAPTVAADALLRLLAGRRVAVGELQLASPEALEAVLAEAEGPLARAGVLLFHAAAPTSLTVVEGAHRSDPRDLLPDALDHGIRYAIEPGALLAVHRAGRFRLEAPLAGPVTLFHPRDATPAPA